MKDIASHPETTDDGTGTTLTGVYLDTSGDAPHWVTLNIGDSRVYLVRDGAIVQVTTDHSVVQELIAVGSPQPRRGREPPVRQRDHARRRSDARASRPTTCGWTSSPAIASSSARTG